MITSAPPGRTELIRQAQRNLERIGLHIRSADEKIRALFGANTLLAAALTFTDQVHLRSLPAPWGQLAVFGTSCMLLATVCSILLAMVALDHRLLSVDGRPPFAEGAHQQSLANGGTTIDQEHSSPKVSRLAPLIARCAV